MNIVHAAVVSGDYKMAKYILKKTKEDMHIVETSTGATVLHIAAGEVSVTSSHCVTHNSW